MGGAWCERRGVCGEGVQAGKGQIEIDEAVREQRAVQ